MKKRLILFLIPIFYLGLILTSVAFADDIVEFKNKPVYRYYNKDTQEHMYTQNDSERRTLAAANEWSDEGIGWYAPEDGEPVYRLNNSLTETHLFTTNEDEVKELEADPNWTIDYNGTPVFYSGGTTPIYRLYNRELFGIHHLTTNPGEYVNLGHSGWSQEGVQFYGTDERTEYVYPDGDATLDNTPCQYGIESDVSLNGSGSGYHSKIVICSPTSAVSFGVQRDEFAAKPYTGRSGFIIENVHSNDPGGQEYSWAGYADLSQTFHLMLTIQSDGTIDTYINGTKVNTTHNSELAGQKLYLRVEGSGRKNGDVLDANFSNIKLVSEGINDPTKNWNTHFFQENPGIDVIDNFKASRSIRIRGTIQDLNHTDDWDSQYEGCSGIIQFVE